jgi:hypothetical protein
MAFSVSSDERQVLRRYLLGELPPNAQDKVEALFADPDYFAFYREVERDLLREYATKTMQATDICRFEQNYLVTDKRRSQLVVLQACLEVEAAQAQKQQPASAQETTFVSSGPPKTKELPLWATLTQALGRLDPKTTKLTMIAASATLCVILLAFVVITRTRPVPIEAATATAETRRDAAVYAGPTASEKKIAALPSGTLLNVLRLPDSADQQWIRVQRVSPKVFSPGYIRLHELTDWKAKTGSSALALVRLFRPPDSATTDQIQEQINKLNDLVARFSTDPVAKEARLDVSRWKLLSIRRQQEAGSSGNDLAQALTSLRPEVDAATNDPKLQDRAHDLLNQIDSLYTEVQAAPPPPQPQPAPNYVRRGAPGPILLDQLRKQGPSLAEINSWMDKARAAWDNDGDYTLARQYILRILQYQPSNKEALNLKTRIEAALTAEKAYETNLGKKPISQQFFDRFTRLPSKQVKQGIDGAQQAFCREFSGLSRKYPFDRKAETDDARPEDVTKVFAPQDSAFATLKMALGDNLVRSGSAWTQKPDAPVKLSPAFLNFFTRASAISETLFQGGSLGMRYKLSMKRNPAVRQVNGQIDAAPLSTSEKEYHWSPSNPIIDLRVVPSKGGSSALRRFSGPWATFRLFSGADKTNGREFALINLQGGGGSPQTILPDGSPIVLSVAPFPNDMNPFDPAFFQLACPGRATE